MSIEQRINSALNSFPVIKKIIKRTYQITCCAVSRKPKYDGNIEKITPDDGHEYFFGYYDKSPWDISNRYMLCLRAKNTTKNVAPKEPADIVLIDTQNNNSIKKLATTHSWNVQQGCMAGWLGPDFKDKIFYNDFRNGKHYGIILNINTGKETIYEMPFYTVSNDGKTALTLDFTRLHRLRPGYGYSNLEDKTKGEKVPKAPCIWKINLASKKITPILNYEDLYVFEHRPEMEGAEHKVNHLMLSPNGKRFMVIHRWLKSGKKYSRLLTCNTDGSDIYNLSDDNMVSHCYWKNDKEILAFCRKKNTNGYYLMEDKTQDYKRKWDFLESDGHPSYSPDGKHVVTDTYPDRNRVSTIKVLDENTCKEIAKVKSPFRYDNDVRCDLHPRWSRDGNAICFDGCFDGKRSLYKTNIVKSKMKLSIIVPVYNTEKYLDKCLESITKQTYDNIEIIIIDDGSTDKSFKIYEKYKNLDGRIKIVKQKNKGLGAARNKGIEVSTGDYLTFVDSDDWVEKDIYEHGMNEIMKYDADLFDFECVKEKNETNKQKIKTNKPRVRIYKKIEASEHYARRGMQSENCPYSVCRKIFKRELIEKLSFSENESNEDILVSFRATNAANIVIVSEKIGYHYRQSQNSITTSSLSKKDLGIISVCEKMLQEAKSISNKTEYYSLAKLKRCNFSIISRIAAYGTDSTVDEAELIENMLPKLKKDCIFLLKTPMPLSRKVLLIGYCINYKTTASVIKMAIKL